MNLSKRHAEAGRTSVCESYFFFPDVPCHVEGAAPGNGAEEQKASGSCRETQHPIRKHVHCFPTARGQPGSQRATKLGRPHVAREETHSTWRWFLPLPANPEVTGKQNASDSRQHGSSGVGATYAAVFPGRSPHLNKWNAQSHSHANGLVRIRCLDGDIRKLHVSGCVWASERHARWQHYPRPRGQHLSPNRRVL